MAGRIEIRAVRPVVNGARTDRPLTGHDFRILLVDDSNHAILVPALSLTLKVGSVHEQAVATIEVPAHLIDIEGVVLRTEAVVAPGGPESQWEESLGKVPGERVADADAYSSNPHVVAGDAFTSIEEIDRFAAEVKHATTGARLVEHLLPKVIVDPMAELDAVIMAGGKVEP